MAKVKLLQYDSTADWEWLSSQAKERWIQNSLPLADISIDLAKDKATLAFYKNIIQNAESYQKCDTMLREEGLI